MCTQKLLWSIYSRDTTCMLHDWTFSIFQQKRKDLHTWPPSQFVSAICSNNLCLTYGTIMTNELSLSICQYYFLMTVHCNIGYCSAFCLQIQSLTKYLVNKIEALCSCQCPNHQFWAKCSFWHRGARWYSMC